MEIAIIIAPIAMQL